MKKSSTNLGVIAALLERLEKQRLPRLLSLKEKVYRGEILGDLDMEFMNQVLADTSRIKPMLDNKPEYQSLVMQLIGLYNEITSKALENEQASK